MKLVWWSSCRPCVYVLRSQYIPHVERFGETRWLWLQCEAQEPHNDAWRVDDQRRWSRHSRSVSVPSFVFTERLVSIL